MKAKVSDLKVGESFTMIGYTMSNKPTLVLCDLLSIHPKYPWRYLIENKWGRVWVNGTDEIVEKVIKLNKVK